MSGIDKATGRVVAVIALVLVLAVSLHGYFPDTERAPQPKPTSSSSSPVGGVVLLVLTLAIIIVVVIGWLRRPRVPTPSAEGLSERRRDGTDRRSWRVVLIAAGLLVAWLLVVWFVSQLVPHGAPAPPSGGRPGAPHSAPDTTTAPQPGETSDGGDAAGGLGYLALVPAVLILLFAVTMVVVARRRPSQQPPPVAATPSQPADATEASESSESLVRAAEVGLAEIGDLSREPREAIIACYAAMERELANVPETVPQDYDTPTEVLARAVKHHALQADNAAKLVSLFTEARFSPHVMNEGHRETAVGVLRLVLAELRSIA
jgi:Na+-transporting methylmalonyl-CoA/oxaloacetate decarboxylase gamma subunit